MTAAGQRQEVAEAIDRHFAMHFGPVAFVLHEIASHLVGVHVYVVGPSAERPYQTLVLHPAEVMLKVSHGTDALIAALDRGGASELLDPNRPSLV